MSKGEENWKAQKAKKPRREKMILVTQYIPL
jgi:hypothetical protein